MLYNIFSNFGNILKILYIPTKSSALLEFENSEYSTICMDYLNNISFMGKPLRVKLFIYGKINYSSRFITQSIRLSILGTKKEKSLEKRPL